MKFISLHRKHFLLLVFLVITLLFFPPLLHFINFQQTNRNFNTYTHALFTSELDDNALNLHYTLAYPQKAGISDVTPSLGTFTIPDQSSQAQLYQDRILVLEKFDPKMLTKKNQLTRDVLLLTYSTQCLAGNNPIFYEMLSPSLGIQAQLPILLAEYAFRSEQDIQDYLKLLSSIDTYFQSILQFQQYKSEHGTFMNDETVLRIIAQCESFIQDPDHNYLDSVFTEKLQKMNLSSSKKEAYQTLHTKLLKERLLPSYQLLIEGLKSLMGTGINPGGLAGFEGGKQYYEYLVKSSCGIYESIPQLQQRLITQLEQDFQEVASLFPETTIETSLFLSSSFHESSQDSTLPSEYLKKLQKEIQKDFPPLDKTTYEVHYVHKDLEKYLSPAFYLTPPIDTLSPNAIYINRAANLSSSQLFTTLAHEGFPGHLYQTLYFASTNPTPLRYLMNMPGYTEGWATYVESIAYTYMDQDPQVAKLDWLNRSLNLCIMSLLDTGIHYNGWTKERCGQFLSDFGITDPKTHEEIYQVIIEDPANYLKYYLGYLYFLDLRTKYEHSDPNHFNPQTFHQKILEIGPCPFPILEKNMIKE